MRFKSDDEAAITFCAESALVTRKPVNALCGADDNAIACRCREPIGTILRDYGRNRKAKLGKGVGMAN